MPFPLAHPAAVLPLRRRCPVWFNFPALVIGSLCPDIGYCFGHYQVERFSHRFLAGGFGFCLPVGSVLLFLFYLCRQRVVGWLPEHFRRIFEPLCLRPAGSFVVMAASLLVGAWTHIFLDSLTHENGWLTMHLPILQATFNAGIFKMRVCILLYSFSTFAGVTWLALAYQNWLEAAAVTRCRVSRRFKWMAALLLALMTLLLSLANHDQSSPLELADIAALTAALVALFLVVTGHVLTQSPSARAAKLTGEASRREHRHSIGRRQLDIKF